MDTFTDDALHYVFCTLLDVLRRDNRCVAIKSATMMFALRRVCRRWRRIAEDVFRERCLYVNIPSGQLTVRHVAFMRSFLRRNAYWIRGLCLVSNGYQCDSDYDHLYSMLYDNPICGSLRALDVGDLYLGVNGSQTAFPRQFRLANLLLCGGCPQLRRLSVNGKDISQLIGSALTSDLRMLDVQAPVGLIEPLSFSARFLSLISLRLASLDFEHWSEIGRAASAPIHLRHLSLTFRPKSGPQIPLQEKGGMLAAWLSKVGDNLRSFELQYATQMGASNLAFALGAMPNLRCLVLNSCGISADDSVLDAVPCPDRMRHLDLVNSEFITCRRSGGGESLSRFRHLEHLFPPLTYTAIRYCRRCHICVSCQSACVGRPLVESVNTSDLSQKRRKIRVDAAADD